MVESVVLPPSEVSLGPASLKAVALYSVSPALTENCGIGAVRIRLLPCRVAVTLNPDCASYVVPSALVRLVMALFWLTIPPYARSGRPPAADLPGAVVRGVHGQLDRARLLH